MERVFDESGKTEVLGSKPVLVPHCNAEDGGNAVDSGFYF
jgi:hypothetical protein